jgi:hypothetical protein
VCVCGEMRLSAKICLVLLLVIQCCVCVNSVDQSSPVITGSAPTHFQRAANVFYDLSETLSPFQIGFKVEVPKELFKSMVSTVDRYFPSLRHHLEISNPVKLRFTILIDHFNMVIGQYIPKANMADLCRKISLQVLGVFVSIDDLENFKFRTDGYLLVSAFKLQVNMIIGQFIPESWTFDVDEYLIINALKLRWNGMIDRYLPQAFAFCKLQVDEDLITNLLKTQFNVLVDHYLPQHLFFLKFEDVPSRFNWSLEARQFLISRYLQLCDFVHSWFVLMKEYWNSFGRYMLRIHEVNSKV